jgi:hypothetical protein
VTPRTSFVGRQPQLQQLKHLLSTTRLLTRTGAGLRQDALGGREVPERRTEDVIADHVGEQSLLLVLDKGEHVVEPTGQLVDELLNRCPRAQILATSRQALGCRGKRPSASRR